MSCVAPGRVDAPATPQVFTSAFLFEIEIQEVSL